MDNAAAPTGPDDAPDDAQDDDLAENRAQNPAESGEPGPGSGPAPAASPDPASAATTVETSGPSGRRRIGVLLAVAAIAYALDVVSKLLVVAKLADRGPVRLLGSFLQLTYLRNSGAAFSLGVSYTVVFSLIAVGVVVVIARVARRLYSLPWAIALGLLLGGAVGNLTDRIARSPGFFRGEVVDFIQLPHFAVFNLADSAISVGGVLMVLLAFLGLHPDGTDERAAARAAQEASKGAAQPAAQPAEQGDRQPNGSESEPAADKVDK